MMVIFLKVWVQGEYLLSGKINIVSVLINRNGKKCKVRKTQSFLSKINQALTYHGDLFILKKHHLKEIQAGGGKQENATHRGVESQKQLF